MSPMCVSETAFSRFKLATLTGPYFGPQAREGAHMWRGHSMTSTEEVPRVSCSISARQAEQPAPENGLVHAFLLQQATSTGRISAPRPAKGLTCGGVTL